MLNATVRVQIQILLYFLKLSLPGSTPLMTTEVASPKKRSKRSYKEPKFVIPTPEDCLESFMDKLSVWQLMEKLDSASGHPDTNNRHSDERDWMQVFCEDVVEMQYVSLLFV